MERYYDELLKETLYMDQLENGLVIAMMPKPGYQNMIGQIAVHYGSCDVTFISPNTGNEMTTPFGTAHFLEHQMFKKEDQDVSDEFASLGADINAYTTYSYTAYQFETVKNFKPCLELLLGFISAPYFSEDSVDIEREIIEQEIQMYNDDAAWVLNAQLLEALYLEHPVRTDITGTIRSIQRINSEVLYHCHDVFYRPSNMSLFIAGDIDPQEIGTYIRSRHNKREHSHDRRVQRIFPSEPHGVYQERVERELVVKHPMLCLGFKDQVGGLCGHDLLRRELILRIAVDAMCGPSSELYAVLYEKGLIDAGFDHGYVLDETFAYSYFGGTTEDPLRLEQYLGNGIEGVIRSGLNQVDFERARRKMIGQMIQSMDDLESIAATFSESIFLGNHLFDRIPIVKSLTLQEVNEYMQSHLRPNARTISVIYPKKI